MTHILKTLRYLLTVAIPATLFLGFLTITGCGSDEDEATVEPQRALALTVGEAKAPDTAPGAPAAIPAWTPTVQSVGYYSDWKLSKPIIGTVKPGKTIFIKVVFSEAMKHIVADDKTARPILYYRLGKQDNVRFRIAKHGASGEDFVSGDAKPFGRGTDDFIGKYKVPAEATGSFRVEVGRFSADMEGNTLPAYYTHKERVQIGKPVAPPSREKPTEQKQERDTVSPTVLSMTHYLDKGRRQEIDTSDPISDRTDIYTVVQFSEPVTPVITYTTGNTADKRYTLSQRHGTHWRGLCKPMDTGGTSFLCYATAREDAFSVTVTTETSDPAGNRLPEAVTTPTLEVSPVAVTDPTPVEVPDPVVPETTAPTKKGDAADLIGRYTIANIPDEIQSIFSILNIHSDIEIIVHGGPAPREDLGGEYRYPTVNVYWANHDPRQNVLRIIAHELFHAHQYTVAGGPSAWEQIPEGRAYVEAEKKDFSEAGRLFSHDKMHHGRGVQYESAADSFAYYWGLHYVAGGEIFRILRERAPNRYRWAKEWFGK